jgi:hypothetical protein
MVLIVMKGDFREEDLASEEALWVLHC